MNRQANTGLAFIEMMMAVALITLLAAILTPGKGLRALGSAWETYQSVYQDSITTWSARPEADATPPCEMRSSGRLCQ